MRAIDSLRIAVDNSFPLACEDELPMRVFRHIGAAYETGDANCWEAAYARAEAALGSIAGALLVARATAILRLIRLDRPDFKFLPTPCRTLSGDETALLALLRAAKAAPPPLTAARRILDDVGSISLLAAAACALMDVASGPSDLAHVVPVTGYLAANAAL